MDTSASRLPGHGLLAEGAAFRADGTRAPGRTRYWSGTGGPGRARCECGEMSDEQPGLTGRREWHREHKDQVRAQAGAGTC